MPAKSPRDKSPVPALIMGLGHPRQTAYVKSLARAGIPVHAVHTHLNSYRHSRRLTSFQQIAPEPEAQLEYLENFGRAAGGFIVPANDDYVALVSRNRERLSKHFIVPVPDWEIVGAIYDRVTAYRKAASIGIKVPRLWSPDAETEMQATVAALDPQNSDYILKTHSVVGAPADAATTRHTRAAPKRRDDILNACEEMRRQTGRYPVVQEVVPGAADSAIGVSMVISPAGECVLAYCVRRNRLATYKLGAGYVHPYELGSVVWCETTHDDEALDAARELARHFEYTGHITVEFRRDARNGSLYLMKIEPRTVRSTSLSTVIGMDIPTALYQVFNGGSPRIANDYPDGVGWLWISQYCNSMIHNAHNNRRDLLRMLRGSHKIKAFGEDLGDPAEVASTLRVTVREAARAAAGKLAQLARPRPA